MASRTVEFSQNAPRAYPVLQKQSKTEPAPRLAEARGASPRLLCPVSPRWAGGSVGTATRSWGCRNAVHPCSVFCLEEGCVKADNLR